MLLMKMKINKLTRMRLLLIKVIAKGNIILMYANISTLNFTTNNR
jgi:hypothetical protein